MGILTADSSLHVLLVGGSLRKLPNARAWDPEDGTDEPRQRGSVAARGEARSGERGHTDTCG